MARPPLPASGEASLVVALGPLLLLNALAMQISYVASISGFLGSGGVEAIWLVWLVDYGLILAMTSAQSFVIDRFDRVTLMRWLMLSFVAVFVLLRVLLATAVPERAVYTLLYIVAEQQWLLFPLLFWVLASDAIAVAPAKRLFPRIAGWGIAGTIAGLALSAGAPALLGRLGLDHGDLMLVNAALYLVATLLLGRVAAVTHMRPARRRVETMREALGEGAVFIREVPAFRYLALATVAILVVDTVLEYVFLAGSHLAFPDVDGYQVFYALFRLVGVGLAFLVQAFLTHRLLQRFEIKNALLILPLVAVAVLGWALATPGVASAIGALLLFRLGGETVNESARKAFFGFVPEEKRGRVSLTMDSYLVALGTILGALVIGAAATVAPRLGWPLVRYGYLGLALVCALAALAAVSLLRRTYDTSLLNWRLQRRQRGGSGVLDKLL